MGLQAMVVVAVGEGEEVATAEKRRGSGTSRRLASLVALVSWALVGTLVDGAVMAGAVAAVVGVEVLQSALGREVSSVVRSMVALSSVSMECLRVRVVAA